MSKTRILIADDHKIVRMGLKALFSAEKDICVVGEADDGIAVVEQARTLRPDVIIMDLMMPTRDGIEATISIKSQFPEMKIIVLTSYNTSDIISQALQSGADGALIKTADDLTLLSAIRSVVRGNQYISPDIAKLISKDPPVSALTPRQQEVLHSLVRGLTNKDIAKQLGICEQRVAQHVKVLFAKLGAANRTEASTIALRKHLLKI